MDAEGKTGRVRKIGVAAIESSVASRANKSVIWLPEFDEVAKIGCPKVVFPGVGTTPSKCGCRR